MINATVLYIATQKQKHRKVKNLGKLFIKSKKSWQILFSLTLPWEFLKVIYQQSTTCRLHCLWRSRPDPRAHRPRWLQDFSTGHALGAANKAPAVFWMLRMVAKSPVDRWFLHHIIYRVSMSFNHPFGGGFRNHPQYDALFLLGHNGGVTLGAQKSHHRVSIHVLSIRILINQEAASWKSFWKKLPRYFPSERKVASQIIIPNLLQIYSIWGFARCFFSASFYLGGAIHHEYPWTSMNQPY